MIRQTVRFLAMLGLVTSASASSLSGQREVALLDLNGNRHIIATVEFEEAEGTRGYTIRFRDEVFGNYFLSMRPFKCLEGDEKHWCHVPYPYEIKREVSPQDLTDLEYDLLFLWKGAKEYGINMWNGVYYRLEAEGDRITGTLHELDMDILSAPPGAHDLRPLRLEDLHSSDPESHWLPRIVIE